MKKVLLVRHAESLANAGERTSDVKHITLSEIGKMQAEKLSEELDIIPDIVITSSFTRTKETAEPFLNKVKINDIREWDCVREFTFLDTKKHSGTTKMERKNSVNEYFDNKDIYYVDGFGAESFFDLIKRIEDFLNKIKEIDDDKTIIVFSHSTFILICKKYLEILKTKGEVSLEDIKELKKYLDLSRDGNMPENVTIHEIFV